MVTSAKIWKPGNLSGVFFRKGLCTTTPNVMFLVYLYPDVKPSSLNKHGPDKVQIDC